MGDIIDLWSMKRQFYWHPSHYQVLSCIQQKAANDTRVIYIPGNHDETFRNYINQTLFGIEIHQQFIHTTKAKKQNVDGIICGHIHHPKIKVDDGIMYCNDGGWIESCTALVEQQDGKIELLHRSDTQTVLDSADITKLNISTDTKPKKSAA